MGISKDATAFILVIIAGLCTAIGSAVVFFPRLASLANRTTLAVSLGLASGVMVYIALVDIYGKAVDGFTDLHGEDDAFIYATLSFFGGAILMLFLDKCTYWLIQWEMQRSSKKGEPALAGIIAGDAENPGEELDQMRDNFQKKIEEDKKTKEEEEEEFDADEEHKAVNTSEPEETEEASPSTTDPKQEETQSLRHMGFAMLLAVAVHNFPEGMVTYLAYVKEPAVGIALAIGIAIHNIPEGLCVSMPLYYATGNRCYSFWWGTVSGLTEPLGALLSWIVIRGDMGGNANGILFGLVSGMMTVISIQELLPNAHKYARYGSTVTYSFLVGAFLIALSLMLFSV